MGEKQLHKSSPQTEWLEARTRGMSWVQNAQREFALNKTDCRKFGAYSSSYDRWGIKNHISTLATNPRKERRTSTSSGTNSVRMAVNPGDKKTPRWTDHPLPDAGRYAKLVRYITYLEFTLLFAALECFNTQWTRLSVYVLVRDYLSPHAHIQILVAPQLQANLQI